MSGSKIGGMKAAQTIKERDPDFYKRIGSVGGKNGHTGGFYAMTPERRAECGRKGGTISRKPKVSVMYVSNGILEPAPHTSFLSKLLRRK